MQVLSLMVAFAAGVISITSPCCLPLLPGYLGYPTGLSGAQITARPSRTVAPAALFVLGLTAGFVACGATASLLGAVLVTY